jgi:cyclohexyl-isocyanide hydratase
MKKANLLIGFLCFDGFTPLDLIGPHEVLHRAVEKVLVLSQEKGIVKGASGLTIISDLAFRDAPQLDILVVSGGPGQTAAMCNVELMEFIKKQSSHCKYIAGICTGTLLLAGAGLLNNVKSTTHWLASEELNCLGGIYINERVVWHNNIVTGAGVSSGIDLALELVIKIAGEDKCKEIQLAIEYDPKPPFDSGNPLTASKKLVEILKSGSRFHKT